MESIKRIEEILKQRKETHGHHEDVLGKIADYWSNYLDMQISTFDVAKMMILLKISRAQFGSKWNTDDYLDMAGYALLGAEICISDEEHEEKADETLRQNGYDIIDLKLVITEGEVTKVINIPNAVLSEATVGSDGTKSYAFTSGGVSQETHFGFCRPSSEGE